MSRLKDSSSGVWRDRYSKLSKTHFISYGRNKGQKIGMSFYTVDDDDDEDGDDNDDGGDNDEDDSSTYCFMISRY